jgi:aminopeptidase N
MNAMKITPPISTASGILLISIFCVSCGIFRKNESGEMPTSMMDSLYNQSFEDIDLEPQNDGIPVYQASAPRINDIQHMDLSVRFDFDSSRLFGKAILDIKPWFYPVDSLILDAKAFEVSSVLLSGNAGKSLPLAYKNTGETLRIALDRSYNRTETYQVQITYIANPEKVKQQGSDAITTAKGLYFINPRGEETDKPTQVWTQGETESNSCWFPTVDKPNEKITHQISITVPEKYKTLSNGIMKNSQKNNDGTRTDIWKMDLPHAPYLVMMAVGEYSVVRDTWRSINVDYYVEKEYEPYARKIFGNTPEMLEFFSKLLGVDYPWQKYSQVVVRDYVSGAMENTSATIFGEFVQQNPSEMLDQDYEGIIAHELFHHWFGDLVTCESWANLPLNESFATLSEYLWAEHKHGRDAADYHNQQNISSYFEEYFQKKVSLIRFDYEKREDMFDRHSYQKGGAVLHMLRKYLGDEAFFLSLNVYLTENRFLPAEIHHLRLAFEKVSGEDLNWFFNQWFLGKGHPYVEAAWKYEPEKNAVVLDLKQVQDLETSGLFKIPLDIDLYTGDKKQRTRIVMDSLRQTFIIPVNDKVQPKLVIVDAERSLVGRVIQKLTAEEATWQLQNAPLYADRFLALEEILNRQAEPGMPALLGFAMHDKFWNIRLTAINGLENPDGEIADTYKQVLSNLAKHDPKSAVRAAAINKMVQFYPSDQTVFLLCEKALSDSSAMVQASAISGMYDLDKEKTIATVALMEETAAGDLLASIAAIYATAAVPGKMSFLLSAYSRISSPNEKYYFIQAMGKYALSQDEETIRTSIPAFDDISRKAPAWWLRLSGIQVLSEIKSWYDAKTDELSAEIMTLKEKGTSTLVIQDREVLKAAYGKQSAQIGDSLREIRAAEKDPNLTRLLNLIGN